METNVENVGNVETEAKNLPDMKFRAGAVTATVWSNKGHTKTGEETSFNTISIERSYKDKAGEWQNTTTMRVGDIPKAALVLNKAYEHILLSSQNKAIAE